MHKRIVGVKRESYRIAIVAAALVMRREQVLGDLDWKSFSCLMSTVCHILDEIGMR